MSDADVTVVCCYNNEKMYNEFVNILKTQTVPCEIIGIDNRGNEKFKSCAAAYNSVIGRVKTKYVIYSHQDIVLDSPEHIKKFTAYLASTNIHDIVGVAGVFFDGKPGYSNIRHTSSATGEIIKVGGSNHYFFGMVECDTVDECFFGGHTEHFQKNPFDEHICNTWHLYAVEQCLRTKSNYVGGGGHVYVCDVDLFHISGGNMDFSFHVSFYKLCKKYSRFFPVIRTTCAFSKTRGFQVDYEMMKKLYWQYYYMQLKKFSLRYPAFYKTLRRIKRFIFGKFFRGLVANY